MVASESELYHTQSKNQESAQKASQTMLPHRSGTHSTYLRPLHQQFQTKREIKNSVKISFISQNQQKS